MLPLDSGRRFVHVCKDGPVKEVPGPAFEDQFPENLTVEGLRDGFPLQLRVGQALEGPEECLRRRDDFDFDAHRIEQGGDFFSFVLSHEAGVDVIGPQPVSQRPVSQGRDDGGVDAPGKGIDGHPPADGFSDFFYFFVDKFRRVQILCLDFLHHDPFLLMILV